jgi:predicted permease
VRVPVIYAMLAGVLDNLTGAPVPQLLAGAARAVLRPVGLHTAPLTPRPELGGATVPMAIHLPAAPPIAWPTGRAVGPEGATASVSVLQAGMPWAVSAAPRAMEFDVRTARP